MLDVRRGKVDGVERESQWMELFSSLSTYLSFLFSSLFSSLSPTFSPLISLKARPDKDRQKINKA